MRNILEYPVTDAEKIEAVTWAQSLLEKIETGIGDIRPYALSLALKDLEEFYASRLSETEKGAHVRSS
jgi:hypothetical protein